MAVKIKKERKELGFASHRGLRRVASFRPFKSVQVGDTGPAESTRQGNLQRVGLLFLGSRDRECDGEDGRAVD